MTIRVKVLLRSASITAAHAWVDSDNDGLVSDEQPVTLQKSGDTWSGEVAVTEQWRGAAVLWKVEGAVDDECVHTAEAGGIELYRRTAKLIATRQRLIGFLGAP